MVDVEVSAIADDLLDLSLRSTNPDNAYLIPLLNEFRASWAIVRQRCGFDAAIRRKGEPNLRPRKTRLGCTKDASLNWISRNTLILKPHIVALPA